MSEPSERTDLLRDDRALRDAFRRGERTAMQRVYQEYHPLVRIIVTHGFGGFRGFFDPVDRDDATQTIFLAAFQEKARLSYDGLKPYAAFLRGIAHNTVRRMLDSKRRFDRKPDDDVRPPEDLEAAVEHAEAQAVMAGFRAGVTDPREQAVMQRYFCDGQTEEQLAVELGITRYRLRKIIAALHKRMTRHMASHGYTA